MAKRLRSATSTDASAGGSNATTLTVPNANIGDEAYTESTEDAAKTGSKAKHTPLEGKQAVLPAFLSKTYEIFSSPEYSSICGWNDSGDTIIVANLEGFVSLVLPKFFKHSNFPSFVRQLNLYGFHKTVLDSKRLEFQHPYFKRDRPDLLPQIKRKVSSSHHTSQQGSSQQHSRLAVHRETSDKILQEMRELRERSDAMEKRLREVELDNAIVRSDNMKLWKHLESAKNKQLIMQSKMKKIMWILFQIYRGNQSIPKLPTKDAPASGFSDEYINSSVLGPKEFRDVLRFLSMDEMPLLEGEDSISSTDTIPPATSDTSRKRKFEEVQPDVDDSSYKIEMPRSPPVSEAFTNTDTTTDDTSAVTSNNMLSIFRNSQPLQTVNADTFVSNDTTSKPTPSLPRTLSQALSSLSSDMLQQNTPPTSAAASMPMPTNLTGRYDGKEQSEDTGDLDLIDGEVPAFEDNGALTNGDGESEVMRKLDDFESSLLDDYDVPSLDSLLQQFKAQYPDRSSNFPALDMEEPRTSTSDQQST